MKYFSFIGAIVACILAIFKIIDLLKNRAILKISGNGGYDYTNQDKTTFYYNITFENIGRRPTIVRKMHSDILDKKKKRLTIHSRVEDINKKLDSPDVFEKRFSYELERQLPRKLYFIQAKIFTTGKNYKLRIKMEHREDIMDEIFSEMERGRERGLIE